MFFYFLTILHLLFSHDLLSLVFWQPFAFWWSFICCLLLNLQHPSPPLPLIHLFSLCPYRSPRYVDIRSPSNLSEALSPPERGGRGAERRGRGVAPLRSSSSPGYLVRMPRRQSFTFSFSAFEYSRSLTSIIFSKIFWKFFGNFFGKFFFPRFSFLRHVFAFTFSFFATWSGQPSPS